MQKRAIIIVTSYRKQAIALAHEIAAFLHDAAIAVDIYEYDKKNIAAPDAAPYALAVSLGGDGTVLFAARFCAAHEIPVFPINFGTFGFIAGVKPSDWQQVLAFYLAGSLRPSTRMLLSASLYRKESLVSTLDVLNDVVISKKGISKICLDIAFNGIAFGIYQADGIIAATPTGSTAYSAAAGGPILDPSVPAFLLTPVAAFSLSNRPIVLPASGVITIKVLHNRDEQVIMSIDGQQAYELREGDRISICMSKYQAHLIGCSYESFYDALRSKLAWSGSSLAR
ncbi:MAG: NAD(+)/NADH kinase [Treponema sp.]